MKDSRITIFRNTLDSVIESLDAMLRVARWTGEETIPEPLKATASHLATRMGAADRLASARFSGTAKDAVRVNEIVATMRRLDAAYVAFCRQSARTPVARDFAASALAAEIDGARGSAA